MNGPEHYREAERLISDATDNDGDISATDEFVTATLAAAQVHATLALAAATALNDAEEGMALADNRAWKNAAGVNTQQGRGAL